ncbi:MAG: hypothetical protein V7749_00095 [Cocleimonas sp.]|jgi:hypothetical protein
MATKQNAKRNDDSDQQVRRKTGVAKIDLKSEAVYLHMRGQAGDALNNSLYRLGELFKMTNRSANQTTYIKLKEWYENEIISVADNDIDKLVNYFQSLQNELAPGYSFIDIKNPVMNLDISIIHKSHLEVINIISKIDFVMDDIEAFALSGSFDDDIEKSSRHQALIILNNISSKIFKVTKPGKRNGGPFSPVFFLEGLQKGVFSLYPDAIMNEEINVVNMESKSEAVLVVEKPTNTDIELTEVV